jgi:lysophospholipase L1-like esterase
MRAHSPVALVAFAAMCLQCGGGNARIPTAAATGVDGSSGSGGDDSVADSSVAVSDATRTGGDEVGSDDAGRMIDATPQSKEGGPATEAGTGPYSPCPTDGSACKILPLGDSITYGIQYAGGYRVELFQDAQTAHQHITFVGDSSLANGPTMVAGVAFPQDNDGHSGWTIDQIAGLVPSPALQTNPDIVLLLIGTNDMYSTSQPVAQAPQRLAALLDALIKGDARALLIVAQITPLQNSTWETQVVTYNAAIPALVQARAGVGKHIAMVDMHTGFVTATMLSSDGVHPNQAGYNHMGDVWYAALKDVLH